MTFTETELEYLATQPLGRLATAQPNGTLQVSPVGFAYNATNKTIDIGGYDMAASRKFRNVAENSSVAFVVDDIVSQHPWRVRFIEIRGHAEAITDPVDSAAGIGGAIIRIHPGRIISFSLDNVDAEPHDVIPSIRNVTG